MRSLFVIWPISFTEDREICKGADEMAKSGDFGTLDEAKAAFLKDPHYFRVIAHWPGLYNSIG